MPDTFAYKVRDKSGQIVSGTIVADNEALVLQRLREQGYTPLDVSKQGRGMNIELSQKKVKLKELAVFSRQFATMVNSGLPILRGLSILADQTSNKTLQTALATCRLDVEQGASLSQAFQKHPKIFNDLYVSMVKSGETGGSLDRPSPSRRDPRERGQAARQDQERDDVSRGGRRARRPDHVGDAAVRRPAVRDDLRVARWDASAAHAGAANMSELFKTFWWMVLVGAIAARFALRGTRRPNGAARSSTA